MSVIESIGYSMTVIAILAFFILGIANILGPLWAFLFFFVTLSWIAGQMQEMRKSREELAKIESQREESKKPESLLELEDMKKYR